MLPLKIRNNPFHRIGDSYGHIFDRDHFLGRNAFDDNWMTKALTNITRNDEGYHIQVHVPGFEKQEIEVTCDDHTIRILAETELEEGHEVVHEETSHRRVERSFQIPANALIEQITAKLDKGILTIMVPLEQEKAIHTQIKVE